jgi:hypothetical protein
VGRAPPDRSARITLRGDFAMPDQTVQVTFNGPGEFSFNPESPTLTAAGKVVLHRSPADANWTFVSVDDLPSPQFTWTVTGNGSNAEVSDGHTSIGQFHYGVTVRNANGTYSSDDNPKQTTPPMIVNQ